MPNSNLEQLIATAALLRPMLGDLVFVGGAVTTLLVTDAGAGTSRPTMDADAIATKIEAFKGRGRGDFFASHDLEDLIFVMDGRSTIVEEVQTEAPPMVRWNDPDLSHSVSTPN